MKMSNSTYDVIKWAVMVVLPALATFYAAIGKIWGLPYTTEIPSTLTALSTLLGACAMISSANYKER